MKISPTGFTVPHLPSPSAATVCSNDPVASPHSSPSWPLPRPNNVTWGALVMSRPRGPLTRQYFFFVAWFAQVRTATAEPAWVSSRLSNINESYTYSLKKHYLCLVLNIKHDLSFWICTTFASMNAFPFFLSKYLPIIDNWSFLII